MNSKKRDIPWTFIPLSYESVTDIRAWIHRLASTKTNDEQIAKSCESLIETAFSKHELVYDIEKYGDVKMTELRLLLGSDGICIPEKCFSNPPKELLRVDEPLRPLIKNT